ncbi:MAG: TetR/AcrR family transcriptional regulator [Oscillospiraceae bacterium]|nr:TetR/AcrR family transcriptional regulator [Oscillospiraceae bacterium]
MYTGSNPSAIRSRNEIVRSFLEALEHTDLEALSVKQIMDATDLSRQTFYQIFNSKDEIIEYCLDTLFSDFLSHTESQSVETLCDAAKLFFSFFDAHRHTLELFIRNGKSCVVQRKCREYLRDSEYIRYDLRGARSDSERDFAATFVVSGMVAMLEQWIRQTPSDPMTAEHLARLVCRITGTKENAVEKD